MASHGIDPNALPYTPAKLDRKGDIGKPSYKLRVDFGPVVGTLQRLLELPEGVGPGAPIA